MELWEEKEEEREGKGGEGRGSGELDVSESSYRDRFSVLSATPRSCENLHFSPFVH